MTETTDTAPPQKKILLIDDSEIVLTSALNALSKAGYEVKSILYPSGVSGTLIEEVLRYAPTLVLSDVDMPLLKGQEFAKIAKTSPRLKNIKLYFYSSQPEEELKTHVKNTSADGYIHKSVNKEEFLSRVKSIMDSIG